MKEIRTTQVIEPKIYGYIHPDYDAHKGYIKIGKTERTVEQRVKEDHITNNIKYEIVFECLAINNKKQRFEDTDFHEFLLLKGYDRLGKTEFFRISKEDLILEMEDFKKNNFSKEKNREYIPYILRDEQNEAVNRTIEYYNSCYTDLNKKREFLWNAKPRFGKTLTAYDLAKKMQAKKILIITNRPAIQDSWFTDYVKYIQGYSDYYFISAKPIEIRFEHNNNEETQKSMSRQQYVDYLVSNNKSNPYIFFISLQDIKGNNEKLEFKEKNKWLFDEKLDEWDLVVIDESHEGVETAKAAFVLKNLKKRFTLYLSGTPFRALASEKFSNEQIYNWTYVDEQRAKENWNYFKGENPYLKLPKMNIFTYELSKALEIKLDEARELNNEFAFDLTEFFRVNNDEFVYKEDVLKFLDNLAGLNTNFDPTIKPYPFATKEIRNELKHTFWLMPNRVEVVSCMKKVLKNHELFKDYEVILAAGTGDNEGIGKQSLEKVQNAIRNYDKTITLSCGQLTTGITIPEWTGVLMLSNTGSPSQYLQTAFRAQNPYVYTDSETLKTIYKTDCYLFDFAPDRVLKIIADYANDLIGGSESTREPKIRKLLNFLTVLAEDDEGKLKELDAREVLELPLKIITKEVTSRGFMSNKLFDNISNVFGVNTELREIINKLTPEKNKKLNKPFDMPNNDINLDQNRNIVVKDDEIIKIINTSNGKLGGKRYAVEGSAEALYIQEELQKYKSGNSDITKEDADLFDKTEIITKEEEVLLATAELTKKKEKDKNSEENQIRDRLRGFSRTIPMFLMAYSRVDKRLSLNNFDHDIPEKDFKDITSISKSEFHKLREANLFNEDVFNASINEFIEIKKRLANFFINSNEDIFDYIPPQKTNQIFTPKKVVNFMVDLLEKYDKNIFKNKNTTFIDLYMKSGLYIAEIIKRLYEGLRREIPNDNERIIHILTNQVYGLAPTNILYNICTEYIIGFLKDNPKFTSEDIFKFSNNFKQFDLTKHINQEKNWTKEIFGDSMKFDVVIGNPPFQEDVTKTVNRGRFGGARKDIWHNFIIHAQSICKIGCFINPSWELNKTHGAYKYFKEHKHLSYFILIPDAKDIFPDLTKLDKGLAIEFLEYEKIIENPQKAILQKNIISSFEHFDFNSKHFFNKDDEMIFKKVWKKYEYVYQNQLIKRMVKPTISNKFENDGYSVSIASLGVGNGSKTDQKPDGMYSNNPIILKAGEKKESWFVFKCEDNNYEDAKLLYSYLITKFVRRLLNISQKSMHVKGFDDVPDYGLLKDELYKDGKKYFTDEWLYKYFELNQDIINDVDKRILPKEIPNFMK